MSHTHLLTNIRAESEEWNILEHYFMACSRTFRARMRQAFSLTSPKTRPTFSYHSNPMPTPSIFVWVNTEELDAENQLEKVLKRGFSIQEPYGMTFVHGNIALPNLPLVADPDTYSQDALKISQRQFKYLFCELLIGKPLQVDNLSLATWDKLLPEFDSFYVKSPSSSTLEHDTFSKFLADENTDTYSHHVKSRFVYTGSSEHSFNMKLCHLGVLPAFSFQNHYVIFNSSQVIVRNIVYIDVDPSLPENFALPLCENCQSVQADVWCKADHACFCKQCDEELHLHSKLASRHTRLTLCKRPRSKGYCFIHSAQTYIYYCLVCEKSLCTLCLPHCPHFNQEEQVPRQESNPIVPLNDTTFFSIDFFLKPKHLSSTILNEAKTDLAHLKDLYTKVENNMKGLEHEMHTIISNAFQQLDNLIGYRTISILNRKNSLHIAQNLSHLNDKFICYLNSVLPPPDFLFSWLHYKKIEPKFYKPLTLLDEEIIRDTITWQVEKKTYRIEKALVMGKEKATCDTLENLFLFIKNKIRFVTSTMLPTQHLQSTSFSLSVAMLELKEKLLQLFKVKFATLPLIFKLRHIYRTL